MPRKGYRKNKETGEFELIEGAAIETVEVSVTVSEEGLVLTEPDC